MVKLNFQNLVLLKTIAYFAKVVNFIIDLIFITARLEEKIEQFEVYNCNHNLDHKAIHSSFFITILISLSTS